MAVCRTLAQLKVDGAHVALKQLPAPATAPAANGEGEAAEGALAVAFFHEVLCGDMACAPLSVRALAALEAPADVPLVLQVRRALLSPHFTEHPSRVFPHPLSSLLLVQRVSGYVASFRRACSWLQCFERDGWAWAAHTDVDAATGTKAAAVVATPPAVSTRAVRLVVQLKVRLR